MAIKAMQTRTVPSRLLSIEHLRWKSIETIWDSRNMCITNAFDMFDYVIIGADLLVSLIAATQLASKFQSAKILIVFDFLVSAEKDFIAQQQKRFICLSENIVQYLSQKLSLELTQYNEEELLRELVHRAQSEIYNDEYKIEMLKGSYLTPAYDYVKGKEGYHLFWIHYDEGAKLRKSTNKYYYRYIRELPTISLNKKKFKPYKRNQFVFAKKIILTSPPDNFDTAFYEKRGDLIRLSESAHPVNECQFSFRLRLLDFIGGIECGHFIENEEMYNLYLKSWERNKLVNHYE